MSNAREHRLRLRIDALLEDRERLTEFLRIAEQEQDRLVAEHAQERKALRARINDLERSRKMWRERYLSGIDAAVKTANKRRSNGRGRVAA